MISLLFVFVLCAVGDVFGSEAPQITACSLSDKSCVQSESQKVFDAFIQGIPSLGIDSSDPLTIELIESDLAGLKYKFTDVTTKGYKSCKVGNVDLNLATSNLKLDLTCQLFLKGTYEMSGRLLILPIEGQGDFTIKAKKMLVKVNADLKKVKNNEGKTFMSIKKFTVDSDALDQVTFNFKNLFNGNKELADGIHKFANENYKDINRELGGPIFNTGLKKLIKTLNKYLKHVALEDVIVQ